MCKTYFGNMNYIKFGIEGEIKSTENLERS